MSRRLHRIKQLKTRNKISEIKKVEELEELEELETQLGNELDALLEAGVPEDDLRIKELVEQLQGLRGE